MRIATVLLAILLAGCMGRAQLDSRVAAFDKQIADNAQRHGIAAQSILVMRDGDVLYRGQAGVADLESKRPAAENDVYAAHSISKLFVSILALQLVDQDRLDLQAPAGLYVPELPPAWQGILISQFLNHVSGVPDFFDAADPGAELPATREEVFHLLGERPLLFEPGEQALYTQTNYLVLQIVLERIYGATYRDIVRAQIIEPLGLRDTYLGLSNVPRERMVSAYRGENDRLVQDPAPPWRDYSIAHGELFTTPDDLGAFLTAVANGELVRQQTLLKAWRPYRLPNGERGVFASGWDHGESGGFREVGLDGGMKVRVRILFRNEDLSKHTIIVYFTNGSRDNVWTRTLVESVERVAMQQ